MRWGRLWPISWVLAAALWAGEGTVSQAWASSAEAGYKAGAGGAGNEEPEDQDEDFQDEDFWDEEELSDEEVERLLDEYFRQMDEDPADKNPENFRSMEAVHLNISDMKLEPEEDGGFRYVLPNGNYFVASVPCGMITGEAVTLTLTGGTVGTMRRDDVTEMLPDSGRFTQKGSYHIRLLMFQLAGGTAADYNVYEVNFYFTIIGGRDNTLGAVPAPERFVISEVLLDGRRQKIPEERCFFLGGDGEYQIRFQAADREGLSVETRFVRDTQAPFLSFSPEPQGGAASGAVEFVPSEPDCRVYINYNGSRGYAVSSTLTSVGNYGLSVVDEAGNAREYQLWIRQTYDPADWRLILAAVVLAGAGAVRLLLLRRDMKVI